MNTNERDDEMLIEFKAVLKAILIFLEAGQTETAIEYIKSILQDK